MSDSVVDLVLKNMPSRLSTTLLATLSAYTTYVMSAWLYSCMNTPPDRRRLEAAKKKGRHATINDIPGPRGVPFFGSFFIFLPYISKQRIDLMANYLNETYKGICKIRGDITIVFIDDAAMTKKIINSPDVATRGKRLSQVMFDMAPTALFCIDSGEQWKMHRKTLQPAFGPGHLRVAFNNSLEYVDKLLKIWQEDPRRNVMNDFSMVTGDVIGKVAFSMDLGSVESLATHSPSKFFHHAEELTTIMQRRFGFFSRQYLWSLLGISSRHVKPSVDFIMNIFHDEIKRRRASYDEDKLKKRNWDLDLLDRLLAPDSNFSEAEILSEVFGFFLAGHETTANSLTWAVYELCLNPHIFDKLAAEVQAMIGQRVPTQEEVLSLRYVDALIKETMRFHSIVSFLGKEIVADCEFSDSDGITYFFQPGVRTFFNISRIHKDEKYWGSDAKVFNPDRWLDGFVPVPGSYLPFSDGPMNCIGQKMALIEAKVVLIRIVQKFKAMSLAPKQGPIEPVTTLTHGLKHGLLVDVVKR